MNNKIKAALATGVLITSLIGGASIAFAQTNYGPTGTSGYTGTMNNTGNNTNYGTTNNTGNTNNPNTNNVPSGAPRTGHGL